MDIESEQPTVTLDDDREFTCDLLLGADGLHVRSLSNPPTNLFAILRIE